MSVAVIPARGGSKRVPRKNLRVFAGKPMIAWPIAAALATPCFRTVIVSTDDEEIAEVARELGARVPFMRPPELADDHTGTVEVIAHATAALELENRSGEPVCCIYPTAAFVQPRDLERGLKRLQQSDCDYVFSAAAYEHPVQRGFFLDEEDRVAMLYPEHTRTRTQDLREVFRDAGQWYWGRAQTWLEQKPLLSAHACAAVIPRQRAWDIDTQEDWSIAEAVFMAAGEAWSAA